MFGFWPTQQAIKEALDKKKPPKLGCDSCEYIHTSMKDWKCTCRCHAQPATVKKE